MKLSIKSVESGSLSSILFEFEAEENSIKITLEAAIKAGTDLRGADLDGANLRCANLDGANLRSADLRGADLDAADLRYADLRGANLDGVNLRSADLRGANLDGANLRGADLRYADLRYADLDGEKLSQSPLQVNGLKWFVLISDGFMRIGCQRYTHEEWANFNDKEIAEMDFGALKFWRQWKTSLVTMCSAHKKQPEKYEKEMNRTQKL